MEIKDELIIGKLNSVAQKLQAINNLIMQKDMQFGDKNKGTVKGLTVDEKGQLDTQIASYMDDLKYLVADLVKPVDVGVLAPA